MAGLEKFQIFFELVPPIFYGGQTLNAKVVVVNSKPIQMKAFYIRVKGRCKMRSQSWRLESSEVDSLIPNFRNAPSNNDRRNLKGYNDSEDYINDQFAIFGWGNDGTLEPGEYSFPFTYTLPMNLPSSFETKFGCIRYTLMAEMHQPWTVVNHKARAFFAIICPLDLNSFPQLTDPVTKEIAKKLCCLCCASGPINIILSLPIGGAVPGETILPTLEVENNSGVDLIFISLRLTQVPCFRPSSVTKHLEYKTYIVEHPLGRLESGQYRTYERVALRIPPVPPSYLLHCKLFDLDYFVEAFFRPAGAHRNFDVQIPLVVGTTPVHQTFDHTHPASVQNLTTPEPQIDATPSYSGIAPPSFEQSVFGHQSVINNGEDDEYTLAMRSSYPSYQSSRSTTNRK